MGAVKMYKFRSNQISLTDFNTPVGMKLNPDNRWVKKAEYGYSDEEVALQIQETVSSDNPL